MADYLERNTRKASAYISDGISRTHVSEYSDHARDLLSSPLAFNALAFAIEFVALLRGLVQLRHAFGVPNPFLGKVVAVALPDVFVFITPEFLAPLTLFLTTNLILPILVAYFFNYSLKSATSHAHNTRRAAAQQDAAPLVDPLVFNITKGLLAYLVYGAHSLTGLYPYSANTITNVNSALYFGHRGLVTSSAIGATIALYEAVLKK